MHTYILCATVLLFASSLCEPTCRFCDWQELDTSVLSKRRKCWEDRSKIREADQKAAYSKPEAVEHSDAGKLSKVQQTSVYCEKQAVGETQKTNVK